jgi:hypothetical protein
MKKLLLILVILLSALPVTALAQCDERYAYCTGGDEYDLGEASMGDDGFLGFDQDGLPVFKDPEVKPSTSSGIPTWLYVVGLVVVGGGVFGLVQDWQRQRELDRKRKLEWEETKRKNKQEQERRQREFDASLKVCPKCSNKRSMQDGWCLDCEEFTSGMYV